MAALMTLLLAVALVPILPGVAAGAPLGKYGSTLSFQLTSVDPLVVVAASSNTLTVTGSYTNTSKTTITDLGYKFQRGDPLTSTSAIRKEAADPTQQFAVVDSGFHALPGTLKAGATATFTATVPITGSTTGSLAITRPGVYPVMINVNATLHLPDEPTRARVGELHLLLTVLSVQGIGSTIPDGPATPGPGIPFSMLWPIEDRSHLGVDGVFTDDDLVGEIAPGGRLATLVSTLAASDARSTMVTLVLDPLLLDELDRMSHGYWVLATPGTPQAALTPTARGTATSTLPAPSTGASEQPDQSGQPGQSGQAGSSQAGSSQAGSSQAGSSQAGGSTITGSTVTGSIGASGIGGPAPTGSGATGTTAASTTGGAAGNTAGGTGGTADAGNAPGSTAAQATGAGQSGVQTTGAASSGAGAPSTGPATAGASGAGSTGSTASGSGTATGTAEPGTPTGEIPSSQTPSSEAPSSQTATAAPHPGPRPKGTVAGRGSALAAAFLDQLRTLARTYDVLVLPYADPDVVALVRAGMTGDLAAAVYRGRAVASRVLQLPTSTVDPASTLITSVAFPPGGLLDDATLKELRSLGYDSAVLSTTGITTTSSSPLGAIPVALGSHSMPALVSDASLVPDIGSFVYSGVPDDWAERVGLLAALLAQQHFDGTGSPMVLVPERDWSPDRNGFELITSLLRTLGNAGVVTGSSLTELASTVAHTPATARLHYPSSAQRTELSPGYLSSLQAIERRIAVLGSALAAGDGPEGADPADILAPLQDAMLPAVSATLRGASDPDALPLQTVTATLDSLYNGVQIRRSGGSYTLASSRAPLLLTVQNTLPYQVTVGISILGGGRAGLTTDDPGHIEVAAGPRTKPIKIPAEVSRSGTFTVFAQLRGPDGETWGPPVPLIIASRAYGVLTLVLMLVAGGVLLLMVVFRIHQRWRGRRRAQGEAS